MNFNSQRVYRQPRVLLLALAAFIASVLSSLAVPVEAASGDLDPTFGIGGKVTVGILNTTFPTPPHAIAIQPDGKIIAAGGANFPIRGWRGQFIVRLNPNGTLDMTFGGYGYGAEFGRGVVLNPVEGLGGAGVLALQPDGKIITGDYGSL